LTHHPVKGTIGSYQDELQKEFLMTLTRKQTKRTARRVTRKTKRTTLDTRRILERIDAMIRELEIMRRQLATLPKAEPSSGLTDKLFGALGHGSWEEYDLNLDWARFCE
jgi:hypothetical protein